MTSLNTDLFVFDYAVDHLNNVSLSLKLFKFSLLFGTSIEALSKPITKYNVNCSDQVKFLTIPIRNLTCNSTTKA